MNRNIELNKEIISMFIINAVLLVFAFIIRTLLLKIGFFEYMTNVIFVLNIIMLIIGIVINVLFLNKKSKLYSGNTVIYIILFVFIIILFNISLVAIYNKSLSKYDDITNKILGYCDSYECYKYNTNVKGNLKNITLEKRYFDYNNKENNINISVLYNEKNVTNINIKMNIDNECFSSSMVVENLTAYLNNFNVQLQEDNINEAFNKRDDKEVVRDKITYKVKSIYDDNGTLLYFKIIIDINL